MPAWDELKEDKIVRMLNGAVFCTNRSKSVTETGFEIYEVFLFEIVAINEVVSKLLKRNCIDGRTLVVTENKPVVAALSSRETTYLVRDCLKVISHLGVLKPYNYCEH